MKVLYFTRGFTPHDRRFLEALAGTPHSIDYLPLLGRLSKGVQAELPENVTAHAALLGANRLSWHRFPEAVREFRSRVDQINPDLVHAGPIHLSASIAAMAGFHPLVTMSWGSDLLWETRKPWIALVARFVLRRSDAFVGDCQAVKQAAIRFGMHEDRIVLFPWGTDLNHFTPGGGEKVRADLGWEDDFILLSTRSFEPIYGVDLIVKGFIRTAPEQRALKLLLLGEGSQRSVFENWLDAAGLASRAHFAGAVSREMLPDYYRSADLYLSGSYSDGSSVSLLEAMACGTPALVSDIPGNREWVQPGENGWWFRTGDVASLSDGVLHALEERSRLEDVGKKARRLVEQRADWNENFPKLIEAYEIAVEHQQGVTG
ncbi:MAG: glycosyltransferase family 4 protein [Anaerolineales bacterium]|nr:glycosyltransferase family 4 protein [Anaerolineales bacterium]